MSSSGHDIIDSEFKDHSQIKERLNILDEDSLHLNNFDTTEDHKILLDTENSNMYDLSSKCLENTESLQEPNKKDKSEQEFILNNEINGQLIDDLPNNKLCDSNLHETNLNSFDTSKANVNSHVPYGQGLTPSNLTNYGLNPTAIEENINAPDISLSNLDQPIGITSNLVNLNLINDMMELSKDFKAGTDISEFLDTSTDIIFPLIDKKFNFYDPYYTDISMFNYPIPTTTNPQNEQLDASKFIESENIDIKESLKHTKSPVQFGGNLESADSIREHSDISNLNEGESDTSNPFKDQSGLPKSVIEAINELSEKSIMQNIFSYICDKRYFTTTLSDFEDFMEKGTMEEKIELYDWLCENHHIVIGNFREFMPHLPDSELIVSVYTSMILKILDYCVENS